ncbi:MAG: iron hydrogenase small subunit, partial [bacterium]
IQRMIKEAGIDFANLPESPAEEMMGAYTGAATIFGATGGVMEAALRTAYFVLAGHDLENVDIEPVRGLEGVKEASVPIPLKEELQKELGVEEFTVNVAVAHGLGNARGLLDKVKKQIAEDGASKYHFIEVMACPGGCVGGGGQPHGCDLLCKGTRAAGLYKEDKEMLEFRCSHHNPSVQKLYEDYLEAPYSEKAHHLLHTKYEDRSELV